MLQRMGIDTGIDLPALLDTSRWLEGALEHPVPGMVVKAGLFPKKAGPKNMENA
jgi:isopropylmalate/homocitrate/citramalate synthase